MDHETAVRLQAAERYLLDEFSPEERREFEDHYFGCAECTNEVRAASILGANLTAVFHEDSERESRELAHAGERRRMPFFWPLAASAALNVALLVGLGYQGFGRKDRTAIEPQFYQSFGVPAASRGESKPYLVPAGNRFFGARFDLTPGQHFVSFSYQIVDASGSVRSEQRLEAPAGADSELELAVPVQSLQPGEYQLILVGTEQAKSVEISRARFVIQPQKGK